MAVCRSYLCFLLLLVCTCGRAQTTSETRIEFDTDEDLVSNGVANYGADGMVLLTRTSTDGNNRYTFKRFDTALEQVDTKRLNLDKKLKLEETYETPNKSYYLFKSKKGAYEIVTLDGLSFEMQRIGGDLPRNTSVEGMIALGDNVFFKATTGKASNIWVMSTRKRRQRVIPIELGGYRNKDLTVIQLQVIPKAEEILAFVRLRESKRGSEIYLIRMDKNGDRISEQRITDNLEQNVVSVSASYLAPGHYSLVGTFSSKQGNSLLAAGRYSLFGGLAAARFEQSEGLFYAQIENNELQFFRTYNFLDLQDFLAYLPQRKAEKIEQMKGRKEQKGKELKINYRIAGHNTIPTADGGYLFLGEAYYPTYREVTQWTSSTVNGVTSQRMTTTTVFDGYQYTHAVLCKFTAAGDLLWDRSFQMYPASKPYNVKRFISLVDAEDENAIKMVFASSNAITSKVVNQDGEIVLNRQSDPIYAGGKDERVRRTWSNLEYWYDNYFYAFGYQKIKDKSERGEKRKVYFVNKIKY